MAALVGWEQVRSQRLDTTTATTVGVLRVAGIWWAFEGLIPRVVSDAAFFVGEIECVPSVLSSEFWVSKDLKRCEFKNTDRQILFQVLSLNVEGSIKIQHWKFRLQVFETASHIPYQSSDILKIEIASTEQSKDLLTKNIYSLIARGQANTTQFSFLECRVVLFVFWFRASTCGCLIRSKFVLIRT